MCLCPISGTQSRGGSASWPGWRAVGVWGALNTLSSLREAPGAEAASGTTCLPFRVPTPGPHLPLPCCVPVGKSLSLSECVLPYKLQTCLPVPACWPLLLPQEERQSTKQGCLVGANHRWVIYPAVCCAYSGIRGKMGTSCIFYLFVFSKLSTLDVC